MVRTENAEVVNFPYWSVWVGWAGRLKNSRSYFKHKESEKSLTNDLCTISEPNRTKMGHLPSGEQHETNL